MSRGGAGLRSIALAYPSHVRSSAYYREYFPEQVAQFASKGLARLFAEGTARNRFDHAMQRYATDPFRGARERRRLETGERSAALEARAGAEALSLAGLEARDVGLLISSSFLPDEVGIGNGVYVAAELGLRCAGWNLETACTGSVAALRTAAALVRAGEHEAVLVTVSCSYSRTNDDSDTTSWFLGDGAAAFVVTACAPGDGVLGAHAIHTAETCGTWSYALALGADQRPRIAMRAAPHTGRVLSDVAEPTLRACADAALERAGVRLEDLAYVATTTPTAWFADFVAAALPIDRGRILSVFPRYANVGPVLVPTSLVHGAHAGLVMPGDLVLCFAIGSVSSAAALVMRWGDVRVGALPEGGLAQVE